ncbi:hypothetical protein NSQ54_13945 [Alkalihalobacillus sp. FSL W8-0930]
MEDGQNKEQTQDTSLLHMMKEYLQSKGLSQKTCDQLLLTFKEQLALDQNETKAQIEYHSPTELERQMVMLQRTTWRQGLLSMVGKGFLIISVFFFLQAAVHFMSMASYGNSGATLTHASVVPILIFAVFGYGGLAILTYTTIYRPTIGRPLLWTIIGWVSVALGTGLCMVSMSLWDDILMFPITTTSSMILAVGCYAMYWWTTLPSKKLQRNRAIEYN